MAPQLQEVKGTARIVEMVEEGRKQGRAMPHASVSKIKKGAGQLILS